VLAHKEISCALGVGIILELIRQRCVNRYHQIRAQVLKHFLTPRENSDCILDSTRRRLCQQAVLTKAFTEHWRGLENIGAGLFFLEEASSPIQEVGEAYQIRQIPFKALREHEGIKAKGGKSHLITRHHGLLA
jgi:hypothetical protein